jgi:hypothetical protein
MGLFKIPMLFSSCFVNICLLLKDFFMLLPLTYLIDQADPTTVVSED